MRSAQPLKARLAALVVALVGGLQAAPSAAQPLALAGRVIAVADGDTITLLDADKRQHRIRLDSIDAPEKAQPFGDRSRQSLRALAHDHAAVAHCPKTDKYGRRVCQVVIDGQDVGLEQIRRGMAWHFKRYENEQAPDDRHAYAEAEAAARAEQRGLWRDAEPQPPWDFREQKRAPSEGKS
jgi:endonuclease YncB( thermonuclease family)